MTDEQIIEYVRGHLLALKISVPPHANVHITHSAAFVEAVVEVPLPLGNGNPEGSRA